MAYRDTNAYSRSRLEEELIANYQVDIGAVGAGDEISACAVAFVPDQDAAETARVALERERAGAAIVACRLGDAVIAANLGTEEARGTVFGNQVSLDALQTVVVE